MKSNLPRSLAVSALFFVFGAGGPAFLPPARAQAAAAVSPKPQAPAGQQLLPSQAPAVVARLQPIDRLAGTNRLDLAIGLPLRNQPALAQLLQQLSDPAHPNYRHSLTPEEFAARFGPTEPDYQAVIAFAQAQGLTVSRIHPNRTLLDVNGSVADIEKAFHVTLRVYHHPAEARTFYAPEAEPALDLAVPVLGISGLNNYSLPRPRLQATPLDQLPDATPNSGSGASGTYMGNDFRAAYVPGSALMGAGQVVGLLQFDGYTASDIAYYESRAGLPNVPLSNVLLDGFSGNPTGSGGEVEVSLDIEMAISMAPGLAGVIVYEAGPYGNFHDILNRMATDNLAKQLSCSWYMPRGGADPVADQIFQQIAAQGQSFFNASGDYDAFTGPVDFPGETPYIVQVGGTTLTTSGPGGEWVSEKVWNWNNGIGSGGGISTRYAIPSYQTDINMTLNQGSTTMRNIPDVALTADNVYVRADGRDYSVGGTSCAAPLWAGFTALVNQQAVASGRPVVGFINPAVDTIGTGSSFTTCFHDVTTGNNTSSGSPSRFYAVAGYDLCTGWGTPAGQKLIDALATPDPLLITPSALAFSGGVGGPFSPNPGWLTLTNSGTNSLSWTLVNTSAWFNVSPTGGTLLPGGAAASVSVSVDASAGALSPGVYTAVVAFTNQTSGVAQTRSLALSVAVPNMSDDFDPGIDLSQWSSFGGVVGSTVLATNYGGIISAPNSLWFGNAGSRFATTVPINTSGGGQIGFCLRLANGSAWPWARPDSLPAEGVVLECSTNGGGSWTAIGNYDTPAYYNWTGVTLPIPAAAQAPAALFRWRQLSNSGTNYDHWALDNVIVGTGSMMPKIVMDPQSQTVAVGDPASLSVAAVGTPPLNYQWLLNGTNIDGATANSLVWTNVQLTDAGTYSVLVSNSLGSVMSSNGILTTYVPVCTPPSAGIVSWWRAEGDGSDAAGGRNGVLSNGVAFAPGRVGQAFSFNGTSSFVEVADAIPLRLTNEMTIEFWLKRLAVPSSGDYILNKGGDWTRKALNYGICFSGPYDNVFHFLFAGGTRGAGSVADFNWHHYAIVARNGDVDPVFYIDGVTQVVVGREGASVLNLYPSTQPLHIGAQIDSGRLNYYGKNLIDELSLYNRALSAAEVQAIYGAGSAGKCVVPPPPSILAQPTDETVTVGGAATFAVLANGTPPLFYQWRFNGAPLAQATDSVLTLTVLSTNQAGAYSVVVSNAYGSTNSADAVLTVVTSTNLCAPPAANLVSWWRAEGDGSDAVGGRNGVLSNGVAFAPGRVGQAFSFNGTSSFVEVADAIPLRLTNEMTIEFWLKRLAVPSSGDYILNKGGDWTRESLNYGICFSGPQDNVLHFLFAGGTRGAGSVADSNWHHCAIVARNGDVDPVFYIDGMAQAVVGREGASVLNLYPSTQPLHIGAQIDSGGLNYYGKNLIDELSLYNRALSAAEVQAIYGAGSAGKCLTGTPPFISLQPASQTVPVGSTVTFTVTAGGTPPLSYQWRFNGTNLAGANSLTLALTNVRLANAGTYSVVVTNLAGSVTSSNAELIVSSSSPCAPPPGGLVSWWRAEGDGSDAAGGRNGVLSNGVTFAPGRVGQAFSFNGTSSFVEVADAIPLRLTNEMTIEFWLKRQAVPSSGDYILNKGGDWTRRALNYGICFSGPQDNVLHFLFAGGTRGAGSVADTNWHHCAIVARNGDVDPVFYIDGVARAVVGREGASVLNLYPSTQPLHIGAQIDSGGLNYYGKNLIDELSLYNRALSASEISAIYSAGSAGKCGLVPVVQTPPQSQTIQCSSNASFSVTATGMSPLVYRWYFGSNPIPGATNTVLALTNVGFAQTGQYSVVITNAYGSATSGPAVLTVVDTIPPTILSCASNRTLSAGANCTATLPDLTGEVVATDASGPVTLTQNPPAGTQLGLGITNVTFTVRDSSGNASVCASSVTVVDTTPPFVMACVVEVVLDFDSNCQALLPDLTSTNYIVASDNCSSVSVEQFPPAHTALPVGTNTVLLSVSDSASNQTTRAVAAIVPGGPRIVLQPADLIVVAGTNANFSVLACGAGPLLYQWQRFSTNLLSATNAILALTNVQDAAAGSYTVLVSNGAGSVTSSPALLKVLTVNRPPVAQCADVIVSAGANCQADASVNHGSFDPDGDPITVRQVPPGPYPLGTNRVTLTVTDGKGASNSCSALVIVLDRTPPVLSCPGGKVLEFQDERGAVATYSVTATDACSAVSLVVTPPSGSVFPIGVTPVHAQATDGSGNSAQCSFTVTVLGAQGVKSNVLAQLIALRSGVILTKPFAQKFDETIEHLADSLNPAYWIDQTHLQPRGGNTAMNEEKLAVNKLREIMDSKKCPVDPAVLQGFIDRIVKCDRLLAVISIQDAAKAGLSSKKIAEALAIVAKGDAEAAAGRYANAIEHYRDAWRHALQLRLRVTLNPDGSLRVEFVGNNSNSYRIEVSRNTVDWVSLGTCTADGEGNVEFTDPNAANQPLRFYRAVEQ